MKIVCVDWMRKNMNLVCRPTHRIVSFDSSRTNSLIVFDVSFGINSFFINVNVRKLSCGKSVTLGMLVHCAQEKGWLLKVFSG